jgi:hypothetical protein
VKTNARIVNSNPLQINHNATANAPSGFSKTMFGNILLKKNGVNQMSNEQRAKIVSVLTIKNFMVNASKFKRDSLYCYPFYYFLRYLRIGYSIKFISR